MSLPSDEGFLTISALADRLGEREDSVRLNILRLRKLNRVIIKAITNNGERCFYHCYWDTSLWPFVMKEKHVTLSKRDFEGKLHHEELHTEIIEDPSGKEYSIWHKVPGRMVVYRGEDWYCQLNAADPIPETWLAEAEEIYIPLSAVEAFEQKHKLVNSDQIKAPETKLNAIKPIANDETMAEKSAWRTSARKIAQRLANEKRNRRMNLEQLSEMVYKEMRQRHESGEPAMTNRSGRVPLPASIKRWAMEGIRS
jgi:hypothetical protein